MASVARRFSCRLRSAFRKQPTRCSALFGLPAPAALALSLLKRARDITLSVPILLIWQLAEGGHALKASRDAARLVVDE